MRTMTLTIVLALVLLPASAAFGSAASNCPDARETLRDALKASSHTITPSVARALKGAVDACGHEESDGTEPVITAPMMTPPTQPPHAAVTLPGLLANACGITEPKTADQPDAKITAWRQAGPGSYPEYEYGPANVTYTPAADHTIYDGRGTIYGLRAQSDRTGIVFLHEVPITATSAFAMSGCSFSGGALCWGRGVATVVVVNILALRVEGELNKCG